MVRGCDAGGSLGQWAKNLMPLYPESWPTAEMAPTKGQSQRDARGPLKPSFSHRVILPPGACHSEEYSSASSPVFAIMFRHSQPPAPTHSPFWRDGISRFVSHSSAIVDWSRGRNLTEARPVRVSLGVRYWDAKRLGQSVDKLERSKSLTSDFVLFFTGA